MNRKQLISNLAFIALLLGCGYTWVIGKKDLSVLLFFISFIPASLVVAYDKKD